MNADQLLAHYDQIADAPDAIAHLRRFVLDLAVRGKLAEQDTADEPATELLKRIATEKARLVKAGELKKPKGQPSIDEVPFDLPTNWCWMPLGVISTYIQRGKSPKYAAANGALVVSQKCIQWDGLDLKVAKMITTESLEKYQPIRFLRDGDLLWNSTGTGTIGRVIRLVGPPPKLVCDSHVTVVRCTLANPEYIRAWLRSDHVYGVIEQRAAGSTNQVELTAKLANGLPVPLPPLPEQNRIVAKVDELMALCDRLEAARIEREATRDRLAAASLARLDKPDPDPVAFQNHTSFALDNLAPLTIRPNQIKALRQTILNLAVRGKLVEQDPADEPASELFGRLHCHKAEHVAPAELTREAKFAAARKTPPFDIPKSWIAVSLREIVLNLGDGLHGTPEYSSDGDAYFINGTNLRDGAIRILENTKRVSAEEHLKHSKPLRENSVLVSINGTLGNIALYQGERVVLGKSACFFELSPFVLKTFLKVLIQSAYFAEYANSQATGTTIKNLSLKAMNSFPIPLPPFAEQHRIVDRVNALMALCDRLEASLATADTTRQYLLEALLHEALVRAEEREDAA